MSRDWELWREEKDGEFWSNPNDEWDEDDLAEVVVESEAARATYVRPEPPDSTMTYEERAMRGLFWGCLFTVAISLLVVVAFASLYLLLH